MREAGTETGRCAPNKTLDLRRRRRSREGGRSRRGEGGRGRGEREVEVGLQSRVEVRKGEESGLRPRASFSVGRFRLRELGRWCLRSLWRSWGGGGGGNDEQLDIPRQGVEISTASYQVN